MAATTFFFYLFSLVMLYSAFRVITAREPVHAVLFLMLTFTQASGLWLLLRAEFLAVILVLVYVGAVMVLFLFVVMMLDAKIARERGAFWRHFPLAMVIGVLIAGELAAVVIGGFHSTPEVAMPQTIPAAAGHVAQFSNTRELGKAVFTEYLFPLEIAVTILLVAMISAIALTLRERKDNKALEPSLALRARPQDRLQLVDLATVRPAPAEETAPKAEEGGAS